MTFKEAQRRIEDYGTKDANEPISHVDSTKCCPKLRLFNISENNDRKYILHMIEDRQKEVPPNNLVTFTYDLHVIANEDEKKVYVNHEFLNKDQNCKLIMMANQDGTQVDISKNYYFTVNRDANLIAINPKETIEKITSDNDFMIILNCIFNHKALAKPINIYPTGSKNCTEIKPATIYMYPEMDVSGSVTIAYTDAFKKKTLQDSKITQTKSKFEVIGNLTAQYGKQQIIYAQQVQAGGDSYTRQYKPNERAKKRNGRNIFSKIEDFINIFEQAEEENNKENKKTPAKKKYEKLKFKLGNTSVKLEVSKCKLEAMNNNYGIKKLADYSIDMSVLDGSEIKVDMLSLALELAKLSNFRYLAMILEEARGKLSKKIAKDAKVGMSADAYIELSATTGFTASFKTSDVEKSAKEEIEARNKLKLGLGVKVGVYVETKLLFVKLKGALEGQAKSAESYATPSELSLYLKAKKEDNDIKWSGGLGFNGLALYYAYSGEVKLVKNSKSDNHKRKADEDESLLSNKAEKGKKYLVIAKPWNDNTRSIDLASLLG